MVATITVVIQIISMVLCIVGFFQLLVGAKWWEKQLYFYHKFYLGLFIYSALTLAEELLNGREGVAVHLGLNVFIILRSLIAYAMGYNVVSHLIFRINIKQKNKALRNTARIVFVVQVLLFFVLSLTNRCYYVDEANFVHYSANYFVLPLLWSFSMIYIFYLLIRYGNMISYESLVSFIAIGVLAIVSDVFQIFLYEVHFFSVSIAMSVVVVNLYIINERSVMGYRSDMEVEKLKIDVMLSQIQPHFLYNSLTTIEYLCDRDPKLAKKAISEFAVFLRGNMDSLESSKPIPFATELRHTNAYLALEKLRFEEDITILEQIDCTSFFMPALTLQPIVENAVRHGIRGKTDGKGTVTIAAREHSDCYEVVVTDDGCGAGNFDSDGEEGRHIGIKNVRYRIEKMCSGSLLIDAVPGKGTTVVITLPKQKTIRG